MNIFPTEHAKRNSRLSTLALWLFPVVFLLLFYFYPLVSILDTSFARLAPLSGNSIVEFLLQPSIWKITGFTIWQAVLSTILTLFLGLPGAYLLARYQFRGKSFILSLASIPFVMPTLVVAAAFNALLGPRGWANLLLIYLFDLDAPPLQFTYSLTAILVAHVFYNVSIVLRMVGDFWSHLDPRMGQAAQILGANRWQTIRMVTLPLLRPAIIAAALLVFIFDFTSFGVVLILGGSRFATLEVEIYYQTISLFNLPLAATLSLLQIACTLGMTIIYTHLSNRITHPISLRPRLFTEHTFETRRARVTSIIYLILLLGLQTIPLLALATRSFLQAGFDRGDQSVQLPQLSIAYYQELFINRRDSFFYVPPVVAVKNSLVYATSTVLLALCLGLPAAWALSQDSNGKNLSNNKLNRLLDALIMLPLGTSAVTLGLGMIISLGKPPLDLRTSMTLIPIAHALVAFPFVVRNLTPALRSIRPRLRHAAQILGAKPSQVFRYIDIPIIGRACLVAAMFAFTISLGEFGATALIARPEYPTIPVMIYRFISQPGALNYGQALALSTILMLITGTCILAIEHFRIGDIGEF